MSEAAAERSGDYALKGKRVWVAGHRGMVGAALVRRLAQEGCEVLTAERSDADLTRQAEVERWMAKTKPAGRVRRRRQGGRHPRQRHATRPSSSTTT